MARSTSPRSREGVRDSRLPTGVVTFLFTDIEGSTRLLSELGPAYDRVLADHADIVRAALAAHDGVEVSTEGDSFFAVFRTSGDAVRAAAEIQQRIASHAWPRPLRVRMGVPTGEARLAGRDYVGIDINRTARISAAAHGGQVLVSHATQVALGADGEARESLRDLGEHRLKDLPTPERLYQLEIDGVPGEFPPPRSLEQTRTNLPQLLTTFFGRRRELDETRALLTSGRLLTLTGPGGSGKTRLALRLASESFSEFPDGVMFVPLAALREPELVIPAIAKTYGLSEGENLRQRLIDDIGQKRQLLVLDNLEQLLPAAADIAELLGGTSRLTILATSRSPLGIYGERDYDVPPLALPEKDARALDQLARTEAVALFVDRARAAKPGFALTEASAAIVAEICRRLDGLPLAIELAAARVKLLPLAALLDRLDSRLAILGGGTGDGSERQRTLRGTIAWSYELLSPEEARLFARLGVFLGGASLPRIAAVLGTEDDLELIDQLGSLVDKSLLRRVEDEDDLRVDMLETIREYAIERLEAAGDADADRERHAQVYADLLEEVAPKFTGASGGAWLDRVDREHENVRAAITWSLGAGRTALALRLVAACWRFWQMRGHLTEGRDRADAALAAAEGFEDLALLSRAIDAAGGLAYWQADFEAARTRYGQALEIARTLGDERGVAEALYNQCFTFFVSQEDPDGARRLAQEALEIFRRLEDEAGIAKTLWALGGIRLSLDEWDPDRSRAENAEASEIFERHGNRPMLAWSRFMGAGVEARVGEFDEARSKLHDAIRIFRELADVSGYALAFDGLARLEWAEGHRESAARIAAASARLAETTGVSLGGWTTDRWQIDLDIEGLRTDPDLRDAWREGQSWDADTAVEMALSVC